MGGGGGDDCRQDEDHGQEGGNESARRPGRGVLRLCRRLVRCGIQPRTAEEALGGVGRAARGDAEPGDRDEGRHEVVALDVGVRVRGREPAGDAEPGRGEQGESRPAHGDHDERGRDGRREDPELLPRQLDEVAQLPAEVADGVQVAQELPTEDDVPEPVPGVRRPVDERRPHRRPDRELQVEGDGRGQQDPHAEADEPPSTEDPGFDRQHEEGDPGGKQDGQAVVPEHHAVDRRRPDEPAIGAGCVLSPAALPAHEEDEQQRGQRQVERVRVGEGAHPPGDRREGQEESRPDGDARAAGQLADEDHGQARRGREQDGRQEVHAERRLARPGASASEASQPRVT